MEAYLKMTCPHICSQGAAQADNLPVYKEAGSERTDLLGLGPYRPGFITPYVPKKYPAGAPPSYLPQPTDSTSGDILTMNPVGPWAPGHLDWSPQAGSTGVRPVVDKYSITRYSTGEWRKNNETILNAMPTKRGEKVTRETNKQIDDSYAIIGKKADESNNQLSNRIKDLTHWKQQVDNALAKMTKEVETLECYRLRLKGASRILMIPEAIAGECIELRASRLEPDLVRDDAEQELIKEYAIVGEIRRVFQETLMKVEKQLAEDRAAKAVIEGDWSDKMISLRIDRLNRSLDPESSILLKHKGVARWPENATTLEYWNHYVLESIRNCDEVRQKSEKLRANIMEVIVKGGQDMKIQAERTNKALAETIKSTEDCCAALEATLRDNLQKIADIERLMDRLRATLRDMEKKSKLGETRLQSRNYDRPNVENCRDKAQYACMDEIKCVYDTVENLKDRVRQADMARSELMMFRGQIEKQIACKRKSLSIDKDRLGRVRAHMPKPEEFAADESSCDD